MPESSISRVLYLRPKPDSCHSSGTGVATGLQQPTRELAPDPKARGRDGQPDYHSPIWSCAAWGFPCLRRRRRSGALLPHHFTLTGARAPKDEGTGGIFSVSLSVASPRLAVSEHAARRSSDFPLQAVPKDAWSDRLDLSGRHILPQPEPPPPPAVPNSDATNKVAAATNRNLAATNP